MKKKKLTLLSAVTAAAIMAACTADELLSEGGKATRSVASADPTPIMVSALVDNGDWEDVAVGSDELHPVGTRADQTLNEGTLSGTVQSMALYAYGQSGNASGYTRYVLDSYNSSTQLFSATTMPVFPAGDNSVDVYGWYPAMDTTPRTFMVQPDQSSDANFIMSDLMLANKVSCTRSKNASNVYTVTAAQLTFCHVLSKINMNITPGEGVTITQVQINGVNRTATISDSNPDFLTVSCSGSGGDAITVYSGSYNTTGSALQISAVIPPQTLKNTFVTITANTPTKSDKTATYSLGSTGKAFATGKKYVMNLTVNQQDITPRAHDISDWDNATGTVSIAGNTTGGGGDIELSAYEKTFTYGDGNASVTINGSGTYTASSSNTNVAGATVSGTIVTIDPEHAGEAAIFVSKANSAEYGIINVTVNKATTSVTTPPTKRDDWTYDTNSYSLLTSNGDCNYGTMQYSTDNSTWSTSIPTGQNAGSYTVYYKAESPNDTDYQDDESTWGSYSITVNRAAGSITFDPNSVTGLNKVNGTTTTVTATATGTISYTNSTNTNVATASVSGNTITVTAKGTAGTADLNFAVAQSTNYSATTGTLSVTTTVDDPGIALASSSVGMIVGANGKAYSSLSDMSGITTAVAVVGYKNGSNGYAIALVDSNSQTWNEITNNGANKNVDCTLADGKRGSVPVAPTGTTWKVLNKANYEAMFIAMGSTTGDNDGKTYDANVNNKILAANGTALSGGYWSSSESGSSGGWYFFGSYWVGSGSYVGKSNSKQVRPCLAW